MIHITSGRFKGLGLKAPEGRGTRPTSSARREALYNIICNGMGLEPRSVIDLFAGSGALGLEAFSWGASHVVFVEKESQALACLKHNINCVAGASAELRVLANGKTQEWGAKLLEFKEFLPFDLVLCDPPYEKGLGARAMTALEAHAQELFTEDATLVLECATKEQVPELRGWSFIKTRKHGAGQLCLYERTSR